MYSPSLANKVSHQDVDPKPTEWVKMALYLSKGVRQRLGTEEKAQRRMQTFSKGAQNCPIP